MTKVPATPPRDLPQRRPNWARWPTSRPLWQLANAGGAHPVAFAAMRHYGALPSARFDPHPLPPSGHSEEGVLYAAGTLLTALAERFQHSREIRRADPAHPVAYAWHPTRALTLIDLSGSGAVRLGAAHALSSHRKDVTRRWARALRAAWPEADGLLYASAMTGQECLALCAPAADTFPPAPQFARDLQARADTWQHTLRNAAVYLGYDFA